MAISLNSNSFQPGNKYFRRFLNIGNSGRNPFKIFNKPDNKTARLFSIETCYSDTSFGLHKAWEHLSKPEIQLMMKEFEGMDQLMQLNGIDINNFI